MALLRSSDTFSPFHASLRLALAGIVAAVTIQPAYAAPVGEVEPNESINAATPLLPGLSGVGSISSGADNDRWHIPSVRAGDKLYLLFSAEPQPPSALDPVVEVFDQSGESLEFNDDGGPNAAAFDDSLIVGRAAKRNGSFIVKGDGFGSSTGTYELFHLSAGPNESIAEQEPNDSPAEANQIGAPVTRATGGADPDFFSFQANTGDKVVVIVDNDPNDRNDLSADPTPVGIRFHSEIDVFGPDGSTIISDDPTVTADNEANVGNSAGAIPVLSSGTQYVRIQKVSGPDHPYDLVVPVNGAVPITGACCAGTSCSVTSFSNCRGSFSGAGTTCEGDDDGDGFVNSCDNCAAAANVGQEDNDADDLGNACESCPEDPLKIAPGACGCGTQDADSDGDTVPNCNDSCPADPSKVIPASCGCGTADVDGNKNGVADCLVGPDVRAQLAALKAAVKGLEAPSNRLTPKQANARAARVKKIQSSLTSIRNIVKKSGALIATSQPGFNVAKSVSGLAKSLADVLAGKNFAAKKAASLKQITKLQSVIL